MILGIIAIPIILIVVVLLLIIYIPYFMLTMVSRFLINTMNSLLSVMMVSFNIKLKEEKVKK